MLLNHKLTQCPSFNDKEEDLHKYFGSDYSCDHILVLNILTASVLYTYYRESVIDNHVTFVRTSEWNPRLDLDYFCYAKNQTRPSCCSWKRHPRRLRHDERHPIYYEYDSE